MKIVTYYEGNDDGAILDALVKSARLPGAIQVAARDANKAGGKSGLVDAAWPLINPSVVGGRAIVLVDFDDTTAEALGKWFRQLLDERAEGRVTVTLIPVESPRLHHFRLTAGDRTGAVVLCPVGIPDDAELVELYGLEKFAMDEYVLRLVRNDKVYAEMAKGDFRALPYATALLKMTEVGELFKKNGLDVTKSKTCLQIIRAAAQIGPSTAKIYERLVSKAVAALPPQEFRQLMSPLIEDIHEAVRLLTTP